MRPRHKAAENLEERGKDARGGTASMRPRHKAAENPDQGAAPAGPHVASMRPRHKAAENGSRRRRGAVGVDCFNEAAA